MENQLAYKRHTLAHLLAHSVEKTYTGTSLTLGPAIDNGFYYDIDFKSEKPNTEEDLQKLTSLMHEYIKIGGNFSHEEVSTEKAREVFAKNKFKLELIDEIITKGEPITLTLSILKMERNSLTFVVVATVNILKT